MGRRVVIHNHLPKTKDAGQIPSDVADTIATLLRLGKEAESNRDFALMAQLQARAGEIKLYYARRGQKD